MVDYVRNVNLIEILAEDHEEVPEPPEDAATEWTEVEIRAYFSSGGSAVPTPKVPGPGDEWLLRINAAKDGSGCPAAIREGGWGMGSPLRPVKDLRLEETM